MVRLSKTVFVKKEDYSNDLHSFSAESLTFKDFETYTHEFLNVEDGITRLFFDIDLRIETDYDQRYNDVVRVLTKNSTILNFVFTDGSYCDYNSVNQDGGKLSFHIIFQSLYIERKHFDVSQYDVTRLFNGLDIKLSTLMIGSIDSSVYKNIFLRLPYGRQKGKYNLHLPMKNTQPNQYLVSLVPSERVDEFGMPLIKILRKEREEREEKEELKIVLVEEDEPEERLEKMMDFLRLVKKERFRQYDEWFRLCCLMQTNGLKKEDFLAFSKESGYAHYDENQCLSKWYSIGERSEKLGFPTIHKWLEEDGVDWKSINKKQTLCKQLLSMYGKQKEFTDMNVAKALFDHYQDNLIYTSQGWFHYDEKGWSLGDASTIFYPIMKVLTTDLLTFLRLTKIDENEKEKKREHVKLCISVNKLQNASKIKSIMEVGKGIFLNDDALSTFDTKKEWFCFSNQKAYNLKTKKIETITAKDRILTTCGYPLPERNQKEMDEVMNVISSIIPKENIKSFLSALSLFLYGENINEKFIVFRGEGRNGKGLMMSILEKVMGHYYYFLPTEVLTEQSKGAGRATPELAQTRWARCVMSSEPDEERHIVKTTLNLLTGRDPINVRDLHKSAMTFLPKFTLGMMCNVAPKVSGGINNAFGDRLQFQTFPYTFKTQEEMDETNSYHRLIDPTLKERVRTETSYRNGLFYLLADAWFENKGTYINCEDSKKEQKEYIDDNNPIVNFLSRFEPSTDFIRISVLLKEYNDQTTFSDQKLSCQKFKGFLEHAKISVKEDKSHGHKIYIKRKPYTDH